MSEKGTGSWWRWPKTGAFFGAWWLTLALDQVTKFWTVYALQPYATTRDEFVVIPGFMSFIHAQNPGAAFSMLENFQYRMWLFIALGIVAIGVLLDHWRRLPPSEGFHAFSAGLLLAGATGNLVDRVHKQTVTDFVSMYTEYPPLRGWLIERFGTATWPTYNVADMALLFGIGFFVLHTLFQEDKGES